MITSCYFSKDAYADMIKDSKYADNKDYIPFDRLQAFFSEHLK